MYISQGHKIKICLKASSLNSSTYYYKPKTGGRGKKASTKTLRQDGVWIQNTQVVEQIIELLGHEFVDYGYIKVCHWLRKRKGYIINKKKVYRLMKEHNLLNPSKFIQRSPRLWVSELVPDPQVVFENLEIDIKYIYVQGTRTNAMQLTVLDVKSRYVLGYCMGNSIRKKDVINLFEKIFALFNMPEKFYIRCDNGSQFVANEVRQYFDMHPGAQQEFTRPATPEQNGHIESFHAIIARVICQRFVFEDFEDLKQTMKRFIKFYNTDRIHSGIKYECPGFIVKNENPDFIPQWVADNSIDKSLLSNQWEGLEMEVADVDGI